MEEIEILPRVIEIIVTILLTVWGVYTVKDLWSIKK